MFNCCTASSRSINKKTFPKLENWNLVWQLGSLKTGNRQSAVKLWVE